MARVYSKAFLKKRRVYGDSLQHVEGIRRISEYIHHYTPGKNIHQLRELVSKYVRRSYHFAAAAV